VEGVGQPVLDHRIDEAHVAHAGAGPQHRHMRGQRHAFLATRNDDFSIAKLNMLGTDSNRAQAGPAQLVNAPSRAFLWQACVDMGLPRRVLTLTGGQDLPHDGF
jgi:hypothetical protein